jgi:hypothetical protein
MKASGKSLWGAGPRPRSRRTSHVLGTLWLFLAALAVVQFVIADDSTERWLAGVQFLLAVGLGIAAFASAKDRGDREDHR